MKCLTPLLILFTLPALADGVDSDSTGMQQLLSPERAAIRLFSNLTESKGPTCRPFDLSSYPCTEASLQAFKERIERDDGFMRGRLATMGFISDKFEKDEAEWGVYKPLVEPGLNDHPLPFQDVSLEKLKGKRVLSLGEGYSGFLPYLRIQGVDVIGADICYASNDCEGDFGWKEERECFRKYLVQKDARKLDADPVEEYDAVYGSLLLCCVHQHTGDRGVLSTLQGTVHVLRHGGTARFTSGHSLDKKGLVSILSALKKEFGESITVSLYQSQVGHGIFLIQIDKK